MTEDRQPPTGAAGRASVSAASTESTASPGSAAGSAAASDRRRRANAVKGGRPHRVVIKHSDEEMAYVRALAAAQKVTPPRLYVRALTTGDVEAAARLDRIRDELSATRRLLAAVSNNVNQIAAGVNSTGRVEGELGATLDAVRRVAGRIERVVAQVAEAEAGSR